MMEIDKAGRGLGMRLSGYGEGEQHTHCVRSRPLLVLAGFVEGW